MTLRLCKTSWTIALVQPSSKMQGSKQPHVYNVKEGNPTFGILLPRDRQPILRTPEYPMHTNPKARLPLHIQAMSTPLLIPSRVALQWNEDLTTMPFKTPEQIPANPHNTHDVTFLLRSNHTSLRLWHTRTDQPYHCMPTTFKTAKKPKRQASLTNHDTTMHPNRCG